MLQRKNQPVYGIMAKSIYPSYRQQTNKRQSIQPNQIFITDFAHSTYRYQIKKKRCPLFLINKAQKKKNAQNNSVFTSQGIFFSTLDPSQNYSQFYDIKNQPVSKVKMNSFVNKKHTLHSALNFTRTFTPKKVTSIDCTKDFTPFHFYPQDRHLQSAQTQRQNLKIVKVRSKSTYLVKDKLKTQGNQVEVNQIEAWKTIDVQYEQLM